MKKILISFLFFSAFSPIFSIPSEIIEEQSTGQILEEKDSGFLDNYYQNNEQANVQTSPSSEAPALVILRIMMITAILSFITWITLRFFFRRNALSISTEGKSIEILATVPAGLGSYFLVAKLSNLYYLLALSNDSLRLLDKITDQEAIDFIELNKIQTLPQDIKFIDLLEKIPPGKPKEALEFLREKINKLKKK